MAWSANLDAAHIRGAAARLHDGEGTGISSGAEARFRRYCVAGDLVPAEEIWRAVGHLMGRRLHSNEEEGEGNEGCRKERREGRRVFV
ncbi:hypothetical protein NL676_005849 [Syzygium grande]|nr:hypothetical protein NL676_005849 [Syzygium grande]